MGIIRLLLAISVVAVHSSAILGTKFVGGEIAVEAFFIISGFYMTLILTEKYIGVNGSYKLFITNRLLKLYPIYWTVVLLIIFLSIGSLLATHGNFAGKFRAYVEYSRAYDNMSVFSWMFLVITNIILIGQDVVMFMGLDAMTGKLYLTSDFRNTAPQLSSFLLVPQAWTLSLEIVFYLIAPFIVKRRIWLILLLILLSLMLKRLLSYNGFDHDPWSYRFFPSEIMFFLLGAVAYKLYNLIKGKVLPRLAVIITLAIVVAQIIFYDYYFIPYKQVIFFVSFFLSVPIIFYGTKDIKWDYRLGELSYPVYISHMLLLYVIMNEKFPKIGSMGLTLAIFSISFAYLLNKFVQKPIERFRQKRLKAI